MTLSIKQIILLCNIALMLTFVSCKRAELIPPAALPVSTLNENISYLEPVTYTDENKIYAAEILKNWNNYINDSVSYITDYYQKISIIEAVRQIDNTWLWETDIEKDTTTINVKLFSIIKTDSIDWKLYLSVEGQYSNIQVLKGISDNNYSLGEWAVYKFNTKKELEKILTINWSNSGVQNKIKFTNSVAGSVKNGNFIIINDSIEGIYNKYIDIYEKAKDKHSYIQLNTDTKKGRIKDILHFGDEQWYYWE